MADAVSAALDYKKGRWVFINIINALKPVDGCSGTASMVLSLIRNCAKNGNVNIPLTFSTMPKGKDSDLKPIVFRELTDKYGLCLNLRRPRIE